MSAKILAALATGLFCSGFAFTIDMITNALSMWQVIGIAAISGFLGSLFGNSIFGGRK